MFQIVHSFFTTDQSNQCLKTNHLIKIFKEITFLSQDPTNLNATYLLEPDPTPTVETDLMELDMYFVGTPLGQSFFFRLKRISEALLDNSFGLYLLIPLTLSSGFLHTRYYNYLQ